MTSRLRKRGMLLLNILIANALTIKNFTNFSKHKQKSLCKSDNYIECMLSEIKKYWQCKRFSNVYDINSLSNFQIYYVNRMQKKIIMLLLVFYIGYVLLVMSFIEHFLKYTMNTMNFLMFLVTVNNFLYMT